MEAYRTNTIVVKNGLLTLQNLPFEAGDKIEVIVLRQEQKDALEPQFPLRGQPISYELPFESVAENEWDILS